MCAISKKAERHVPKAKRPRHWQRPSYGFALCLVFIVLPFICDCAEAQLSGGRSRRRPSLVASAKQAIEDESDKASLVPDQIALAASRADGKQQQSHYHRIRNTASNSDPDRDYGYGNLEMNLIQSDHKADHIKAQPLYSNAQSHVHVETSLEDAETAAEYVAKAMKMAYDTRLKEPIRIPNESESRPLANVNGASSISSSMTTTTMTSSHLEHSGQAKRNKHNFDYYERLNNQREDQREHQHAHQQQHTHQHQHQQQQQQQREGQQQQQQHQQQQQQQQQKLLEAQMQAELQTQQAQQAQLLAAESQSDDRQQQTAPSSLPQQPAPVYEKDPVTRSYEVYDDNAGPNAEAGVYDEALSSAVDRYYRTKHIYHPPQQSIYRANTAALEQEAEEKIRVSASTEIPKAEIMKQIEKSVLKYMKELEAEGKIITAPQEQPQKTYYKVVPVPATRESAADEGKRSLSATTMRPKYSAGLTTTTTSYHPNINGGISNGLNAVGGRLHAAHAAHAAHHPSRYQSETETAYQAPDMADSLAPNVEFIYKIKTRAPLQTATVKTVSKPYSLPLKGASIDHFDHSAALKNIEEFDLSHVVTTPENDERVVVASSTSKPQKLYFNSDIYHDINALPYKAEKLRIAAEYRNKLKGSGDLHPDYKGYTGYFAEPVPSGSLEVDKDVPSGSGASASAIADEGYPLLNPYQFIYKKEPTPNKYEESSPGVVSWDQLRKPSIYGGQKGSNSGGGGGGGGGGNGGGGGGGASSIEYDSYSPKFNNNPEGYGYQHTYKTHVLRQVNGSGGGIKRGKRGGGAHPSSQSQLVKKPVRSSVSGSGASGGSVGNAAHLKDLEASLALRPPPKK